MSQQTQGVTRSREDRLEIDPRGPQFTAALTSVVLAAFAITFGALMLGLAIAFGVGGREAAKTLIEEQLRAKRKRESDAAPHL